MINIIGAGPAGLYAGFLLANAGKKVTIYEEHKEIGKPEHCTGIVTSDILNIIGIPEKVIQTKIKTAYIYGPNKKIKLNLNQYNLVLDRVLFDRFLEKKAKEAGAKIVKNKRVTKFSQKEFYVGADGWNSSTARNFKLYRNKNLITGIQVNASFNTGGVHFYMDGRMIKWIVPMDSERAKIGIAKKNAKKDDLDKFLKVLEVKRHGKYYGGFIPIFSYGRRSCKNAILIGDAAGFVKATTGGGILQSLISAQCCYEALTKGKNYELLWLKRLFPELYLHRKIYDAIKKLSLDYIFTALKKDIEKNSRDSLHRWVFKILLKHPELIFISLYNIIK